MMRKENRMTEAVKEVKHVMAGVSEVGRKTYEDFLDEMRDAGYDVEWLRKLLKEYVEDLQAEVDIEVLKTMVHDFTCNYDSIVFDNGNPAAMWNIAKFYDDYWWALDYADEEMEAHDYAIKIEDALRLGVKRFYEKSVYFLGIRMESYLEEVLGEGWDSCS